MENIRFSVHIPVYNVEKYLAECVDSVLNQSYKNFEIILVDDGSTDSSGKICDSFNDSRIRVFHNENRGLLLTRQFSIERARGEYSVFIDSDDTVDDGYFEELDEIISTENCDMVVCSYKSVSSERSENAPVPWNEKTVLEGDSCDAFCREFIFHNYLNAIWCKTIRTSLLKQDTTDYNNFGFCKHGEDRLRSLYSVFNAKKIVYIPKCYYNYRVNEQSITHTPNVKKYTDVLKISEEAYKYFEKSSFCNAETKAMYSANLVKSMMLCVRTVSGADIPDSEKIEIFKDIDNNSFFGRMTDDFDGSYVDKKTRSFYSLFKSKAYRIIILMMKFLDR